MKNKGFSLIELMIVITIMGLFITFTYPSYRDSITRTRRSDGQTALLDLANRMEHYYSEQHTYEGATLGIGSATDLLNSKNSPQNWYTLVIANQTDTTFTLQAIPQQAQAIDDKVCQTLTFNNWGAKGITSGPHGTPTGTSIQCW